METLELIFCVIMILLAIAIAVGLYVAVAMMANKRQRSIGLWVVISWIISPILSIILLLCLGKSNNYQDDNNNE